MSARPRALGPLAMSAGLVVDYDLAAGWGVVQDEAGGATYPFHATAIRDGSRQIDAGQPVVFVVDGGRAGRWEATAVVATVRGAGR